MTTESKQSKEERALTLALASLDGTEPDEVNGLEELIDLVRGCWGTITWVPAEEERILAAQGGDGKC